MYRLKGNLLESPNHFKYRKNILISQFYKSILEFAKFIISFIFAKFKYFVKQIIYFESLDHKLKNDI